LMLFRNNVDLIIGQIRLKLFDFLYVMFSCTRFYSISRIKLQCH
jgi:hypothetical protein